MSFRTPEFFLLLLLVYPFLYRRLIGHKTPPEPAVSFPDIGRLKRLKPTGRTVLAGKLPYLRILMIVLIIIALARPQWGFSEDEILTEGVDIVLGLDISGSMAAEDLAEKRNRLDVAKEVIMEFVDRRTNDRIGLVVFAGTAFTQCPLTLDYSVLMKFIDRARIGLVEDGTAIGTAIGTSINRIKESRAASKIIILLTDGQNNAGKLDPITAGEMAKALGVKIYTIGAGSRGMAPMAVDDPIFGRRYVTVPVDIDETLLRKVADMTGGKYFRATDARDLSRIYSEIDALEKSEIKVKNYTRYDELAQHFMAAAFVVFVVEAILKGTWFRILP